MHAVPSSGLNGHDVLKHRFECSHSSGAIPLRACLLRARFQFSNGSAW
jgi:hypothetical protein